MTYDVIIVGVGGMGSAAAYHLAHRGLRVRALEQFAVNHDRGSSHGLSRIIRLAYFEHPSYVPLLRRAFELWRTLETRSATRLLHVTGALDVGWDGSDVFEGSRRSCLAHRLPHEVLSGTDISARFPAWRAPARARAVYQPDGGFLTPEACIAAHVDGARAAGATIDAGTRVIAWRARRGRVEVETADGVHEAGQLVLTAGAWIGGLAPDVAPVARPERQVVGWFAVDDPDSFTPARCPVFVLEAEEGIFYGFPESGVPGFKIGRYHHLTESVDPDAVDRTVHPRDEAALRDAVGRYFPSANGPLLRAAVCLFTNTPDGHFLIDRLSGSPEVLVVSPCSGHGFKFCSVVGEIVADLVVRGETGHDIALFRAGRFDWPAQAGQ